MVLYACSSSKLCEHGLEIWINIPCKSQNVLVVVDFIGIPFIYLYRSMVSEEKVPVEVSLNLNTKNVAFYGQARTARHVYLGF